LDQEIEACNSNASARSSFSSNSGGLAARGSPPVCAAAGPRLATGLLRRWPALAPDPHCRSVPPPPALTSHTAADCADRKGPPEAWSRAPCGHARAARAIAGAVVGTSMGGTVAPSRSPPRPRPSPASTLTPAKAE